MIKNGSSKILTINILLYACVVILNIGCNESSLTTISTAPAAAPADDLLTQATRIIREGLADQDPLIRARSIEIVATTKQIKLIPKVQKLLRDEFITVGFAAALAIGDLEYSLAKSSIRHLLKDENENVRIAAAYAMSRLGHPENLELLRKAIISNDQTVRANAALLLGKSGDKSTLKFLYWALRHKDSDDKVRFQTIEAIAMLGDERIYPKIWIMLISTYADDRVMGVKSMGALGTAKAQNALITKLDDDILEVRLAAAEQLGMLGDTSGEPEVLDVFTNKKLTADLDKKSLERVNMLTALAIGQIRTTSLTKFLPQLLRNESKLVRIAAAKAVFQSIKRN